MSALDEVDFEKLIDKFRVEFKDSSNGGLGMLSLIKKCTDVKLTGEELHHIKELLKEFNVVHRTDCGYYYLIESD